MRSPLARLAFSVLAPAALLALTATVAGASHTATPKLKNGGTLTIGLAEDPDALDPTVARTFVGRIVFLHMCEKLYDLDSKLNIVPQLAAAMPQISKDKLTYTIKIRSGIKFNDGTPLNAAAVKTTIDRYLTFKGSTRKSEISPISSVSTKGSSVVLHLSTPFSPLTAQLADRAGMILSPKAIASEGDNFAQNPVCVGAFQFKNRVAGDHITLTKSPFYYGKKKVHLSQIVFRIMTDPSSRTQALRAGDIQVEDRIQSTDVPTLQKTKSVGVIKTPITVHLMLGTDPVNARLGQVIQAMEQQIGINVVLDPTEFVSSLNKADAGTFETFAVGWSGRVDPDGNIFGFVSTPGTLNDSGFSDNRLDYVLNGARKSVTTKARTTLYSAAMKVIHDQRPLIYLYHPVNYYGVSKKAGGVQVFGDGLIRAYFAGLVK